MWAMSEAMANVTIGSKLFYLSIGQPSILLELIPEISLFTVRILVGMRKIFLDHHDKI